MHDLTPLHALGGTEPQSLTIAGVTCREIPGVALASVAARLGKENQTRIALKKAIGAVAPEPARFTGAALTAFWMGPDQYMVEAPFDSHEDIAAHLKAVTKDNASVTEQTDGWARFDVEGPGARDVFERLCALNIRDMTPGAAERTSIHHLGCYVICPTTDSFRVYGPRASAGSLYHAISTAMTSAL